MSWKCFEVWSVIRFLFSIILASHRFLTNVLSADQSPTRSLISREALKSPSLSRCLLGSSERWFKILTFHSRRMILPFREQLDCNFRPQLAHLWSIGSLQFRHSPKRYHALPCLNNAWLCWGQILSWGTTSFEFAMTVYWLSFDGLFLQIGCALISLGKHWVPLLTGDQLCLRLHRKVK